MTSSSSNLPHSIEINGITGSVVTVGNNNLIEASIKFKQVKESEISSDTEIWNQVLAEIEKLQNEIKLIPDQHEELRDIELIPEIAKAKGDVKDICENPSIPKNVFLDRIIRISELAGKIVDIGVKLSPFILTIGKLIGITF